MADAFGWFINALEEMAESADDIFIVTSFEISSSVVLDDEESDDDLVEMGVGAISLGGSPTADDGIDSVLRSSVAGEGCVGEGGGDSP